MAHWDSKRIVDTIAEIEDEKFVLPVIQRSLVWTEEKMELLFDTLLKGDSFGGIMVIEEERDKQPLFSYRPFTRDGNPIESRQVESLPQNQLFVIDGQQRLQSFYIGLNGSLNGKILYFDLFSDYNSEYEFKFENDENKLPKQSKDNIERPIRHHFWYPAKNLLIKLKEVGRYKQVVKEIIESSNINNDVEKEYIEENVLSFCESILNQPAIGISKVKINKTLPEENRQRIVELFRRLNDGGTKLSAIDLVASKLKGYSWEMEGFLREMQEEHQDIGLSQDNLVKLLFLLQDNYNKEMAAIEASDAEFAIKNKNKIKASLISLKKFLQNARLYDYYKDSNRSFIPLFFIAYHLFHKNKDDNSIIHFFDNYETGNNEFAPIRIWLFNSLLNGVFNSRGSGWIPYKTGIKKILGLIKSYKNQLFPTEKLFEIYTSHPITFSTNYTAENIDKLDGPFTFYLMYDLSRINRTNDKDHVMPKNILEKMGYSPEKIDSIKNYQLLDYGTNRGTKNGKSFAQWINNAEYVKDKQTYISLHLIPSDQLIWREERFEDFTKKRAELILKKILKYTYQQDIKVQIPPVSINKQPQTFVQPTQIPKQQPPTSEDDLEIEKIKSRIPKWFLNKQQLNSKILYAFIKLYKQNDGNVTHKQLEKEAEMPKFKGNFDQMKNFGRSNHGKIFDQIGENIYLWEPIKDILWEAYKKYGLTRSYENVKSNVENLIGE